MIRRSVSRSFFLRLSLILGIFLVIVFTFHQYRRNAFQFRFPFDGHKFQSYHYDDDDDNDPNDPTSHLPSHPIDDLIRQANGKFRELYTSETSDIRGAAAAYRTRRGRHPPPKFGDWVAYAKEKNALIIEELFDQIYQDLEPFWAIPAAQIQQSATGLGFVVSIRNKTIQTFDTHDGDIGLGDLGVGVWLEMFELLKRRLPDVDIPLNLMDEPRLLVPWDNINGYKRTATFKGKLLKNSSSYPDVTEFKALADYSEGSYDHHWMESGNYWVLARDTCEPDSEARRAEAIPDLSQPPRFPPMWPAQSFQGYVTNWTAAKDPCSQPHLRGMHGTFIQPRKLRTSKDLFPIFSGSKLSMNNDILLPQPQSWAEAKPAKSDSKVPYWMQLGGGDGIDGDDIGVRWKSKSDIAFWRGPARGGVPKINTWTRFHRHRLISMMNGTQVKEAKMSKFQPQNFPLPMDRRPYEFAHSQQTTLWNWITEFADAAFTDLVCKEQAQTKGSCTYLESYYEVVPHEEIYKQFSFKYLPDIDGDTFSPNFIKLLRSNSLPIKATIYKEWHDTRLIPWKHFVPMDNTFVDFWGIMDYFLAGRDAKAKRIAEEGKKWADTVLRQDDLLVYIYRLVLEYARIVDERRERMGFIEDLR